MTGVIAVLASGGEFSLSITPTSQTRVGVTASFRFGYEDVNVVGAISPTYLWSIVSPDPIGIWTIFSGQGTNSAVFDVAGASPGDVVYCFANCAVTSAGKTKNISAYLQYTRS